jgi:hypothetical protein
MLAVLHKSCLKFYFQFFPKTSSCNVSGSSANISTCIFRYSTRRGYRVFTCIKPLEELESNIIIVTSFSTRKYRINQQSFDVLRSKMNSTNQHLNRKMFSSPSYYSQSSQSGNKWPYDLTRATRKTLYFVEKKWIK